MLPPAAFVDQEVFDWEMKNLFLGGWICLGHISQVAEQGRFIRFHGLAQWLGWLWPYAAVVYLIQHLWLGGREN